MVRVASLKSQVEAGIDKRSEDGLTPREQLHEIRNQLSALLEAQQKHYLNHLRVGLEDDGVFLFNYEQLNDAQRRLGGQLLSNGDFSGLNAPSGGSCPSLSLR